MCLDTELGVALPSGWVPSCRKQTTCPVNTDKHTMNIMTWQCRVCCNASHVCYLQGGAPADRVLSPLTNSECPTNWFYLKFYLCWLLTITFLLCPWKHSLNTHSYQVFHREQRTQSGRSTGHYFSVVIKTQDWPSNRKEEKFPLERTLGF